MNARVISLLNEAIALLSGQQNAPASPTQDMAAAQAAQYLRENSDVAAHAYYAKHPLEHWHQHGRVEGRKWPAIPGHTVTTLTVSTPGGRSFPVPQSSRENFMGYVNRVAMEVGAMDAWRQRAATIGMMSQRLFAPLGGYMADGSNWPAAAEAFLFPEATAPDPGWQQVHDRMQNKPEPPEETPL